MDQGILSKTLDWITHPSYSEETLGQWAAFLMLILCASFLWTTVITQIE